jgi:hypothetical protein
MYIQQAYIGTDHSKFGVKLYITLSKSFTSYKQALTVPDSTDEECNSMYLSDIVAADFAIYHACILIDVHVCITFS